MNNWIVFLAALLLFSCKNDNTDDDILNRSDEYEICNQLMDACVAGDGEYCLFGYKWGSVNTFSNTGYDATGPREPGGTVTFSFQENNGFVNTHAQANLPSRSFDNLISCAKLEIRKALNEWSAVANIEFQEQPENSNTDIQFFVADIKQSGVGFPNFTEEPCSIIGGDVILQSDLNVDECNTFYLFVLHEIGHTLGLGHVSTQNIMNPDYHLYDLNGLQTGDIEGIIQIYGEK